MTWDIGVHLAEMVVAVPILWKANRFFNRMLNEREEFPPHAHRGNFILYPKGLEPNPPGKLNNGNS